MIRKLILGALVLLVLAGCQQAEPPSEATEVAEPAPPGELLEPTGLIQNIHDPVIAHEGDTYYVYSTGRRVPIICSPDMLIWELCGRVFERYPAWTREVNNNLADAWAPDISYFNDRWHLYYSVSTFGSQNSAIGLVTNSTLDPESPDYEWVDEGIVLRSNPGDPWNAIDANLVLDEEGEPWLSWGSFWEGIYMRKIDPATGMFAADSEPIHLANRSAGGESPAIEAPFIVHRDGYWYLFTSFDQCCQGSNSTYNVRVSRSENLTGPYVDREGVPMLEGGGTPFLSEYGEWKGTGHNGMLIEDGTYWLVYHAYDSNQNGIPKLRIESLSWDADGWPVAPSQQSQGS